MTEVKLTKTPVGHYIDALNKRAQDCEKLLGEIREIARDGLQKVSNVFQVDPVDQMDAMDATLVTIIDLIDDCEHVRND